MPLRRRRTTGTEVTVSPEFKPHSDATAMEYIAHAADQYELGRTNAGAALSDVFEVLARSANRGEDVPAPADALAKVICQLLHAAYLGYIPGFDGSSAWVRTLQATYDLHCQSRQDANFRDALNQTCVPDVAMSATDAAFDTAHSVRVAFPRGR